MKEEYTYLLKTNEEIHAHLTKMKVKGFKEKSEEDLKNLCFETIAQGNVALMIQIIDRYPMISDQMNNHRDSYGHSPLQVAAWHNFPGMVEFLLNNGADDRRETNHMTALELICLHSETLSTEETKRIIKLLLTKTKETELNTLITYLSTHQREHPDVYETLLPLIEEYSAVEESSSSSNEDETDIPLKIIIPTDKPQKTEEKKQSSASEEESYECQEEEDSGPEDSGQKPSKIARIGTPELYHQLYGDSNFDPLANQTPPLLSTSIGDPLTFLPGADLIPPWDDCA